MSCRSLDSLWSRANAFTFPASLIAMETVGCILLVTWIVVSLNHSIPVGSQDADLLPSPVGDVLRHLPHDAPPDSQQDVHLLRCHRLVLLLLRLLIPSIAPCKH